jgi:uncharacterized protein YndB with AHSA1/START domain
MEKASKKSLIVTLPSDREIMMTRVFDAPRELVFKAMTDPKAIPRWWGPAVYTTTVEKMDVRPGGAWRFVQKSLDGNMFAFNGVYREVTPPERLVYTFEFEGMPGHVSMETITLEQLPDGKTKMTDLTRFDNVEDRDGMLQSGMEKGANESMERLDEYLRL